MVVIRHRTSVLDNSTGPVHFVFLVHSISTFSNANFCVGTVLIYLTFDDNVPMV